MSRDWRVERPEDLDGRVRETSPLPPVQIEVDDFPRFGPMDFAFRFPAELLRRVWPVLIPPVRWLDALGLRRHERRASAATIRPDPPERSSCRRDA